MEIKVLKANNYPNKIGVYLIEDNWNDWFEFTTTYTLKIFFDFSNVIEVGSVKIGQFNMNLSKKRAEIPATFENLTDDFFSLGQGINYYINLNKLDFDTKKSILKGLNDIAYNDNIYQKCKNEKVTKDSLMRFYSESSVTGQFRRVSNGGVILTDYYFEYILPRYDGLSENLDIKQKVFKVNVIPFKNPPSNVHVVTGKNGVGKTQFIKNMFKAIMYQNKNNEHGYFIDAHGHKVDPKYLFSNVIFVSFSAFDDVTSLFYETQTNMRMNFIGLDDIKENLSVTRLENIKNKFTSQFIKILQNKSKAELWFKITNLLAYDNFIQESGILGISSKEIKTPEGNEVSELVSCLFSKFSSGHKIILLIIVCLVNEIEEKSLLLFDEPETHLHPPMLATLIRVISIILIELNGVAIITTHSPIVLQEVPKRCVNLMQRSNDLITFEKPIYETFGTNINSLTREVFGLEVEKSGFHQLIKETLEKRNFDKDLVIQDFMNELGDEARAIVNLLAEISKGDL